MSRVGRLCRVRRVSKVVLPILLTLHNLPTHSPMSTLFSLGREPKLSIAEITAVLERMGIDGNIAFKNDRYIIVDAKKTLPCELLMQTLGGTIKIGEEVRSDADITETITAFLDAVYPEGKIHFSVSGDNAARQGILVKKKLKEADRSVRYIEANNTATILHNNLVKKQSDITIADGRVFVTRGIQDIEAFGTRDYGRPGFDDKSGMLPPKLARMMINLSQTDPKHAALLDPFCGSGTVLMEAALLGFWRVIGNDVSPKAVEDTKKNLAWLGSLKHETIKTLKQFDTITTEQFDPVIIQTDARQLSKRVKARSIDAIVTEPYLGKPLRGRETRETLLAQARELKTLYIESFRAFHKILKPEAPIVCIIPCFLYKNEWIRISAAEEIKKIGFTLKPFGEYPFLLYARKGQWVGREIWRFQKSA